MKTGRACPDCHSNDAVTTIKGGGKVDVATFADGKLTVHQGVIPVVDGKLNWVFLDKEGDGWKLMANAPEPKIQYVDHGTPLTDAQMKLLQMPIKK